MRRLCALLLTWTVRQFVSRRAGKPKNSVPFRNKAIMAATVQISGGDVIYTPDAGFVGGDNFGYTVTDAQGDTADASVDITVTNPVPTPLIASNYSETTAIGTPISVDLLDEDSGYVGLPTITTGPAHGTVSLEGSTLLYTPTSGFTGTDSIVYSITDGFNGLDQTATGTVHITVQPVAVEIDINDTPDQSEALAFLDTPIPVQITLEAPGVSGRQSVQINLQELLPNGGYSISSHAVIVVNPSDSPGSGTTQITLNLSNGQSTEIYVIPTAVSVIANDIHVVAFLGGNEVGEENTSAVQVWLGSGDTYAGTDLINAANTPQSMTANKQYRIPPRTWTQMWVEENGALGDQNLYLSVLYQSINNGYTQFQFNGTIVDKTLTLKKADFTGIITGTTRKYKSLQVRGWQDPVGGNQTPLPDASAKVYQTAPGSAGQLIMVLTNVANVKDVKEIMGAVGTQSAGFSVSAIPVKMTMKDAYLSTTAVNNNDGTWAFSIGGAFDGVLQSDSDVRADLDDVMVLEVVKVGPGTGALKGAKLNTSGPQNGYTDPKKYFEDLHTLSKNVVTNNEKAAITAGYKTIVLDVVKGNGPGKIVAEQYFTFWDLRTGMTAQTAVKMTDSGFEITYEFQQDKAKQIVTVVVLKAPKQNNGVAAGTMPKADLDSIEQEIPYN